MTGKVYLVGGGPGDPGLITVKGLEILRRADVVLYDRLVAPQLLEAAPKTAELILVGKAPGQHELIQAEIDRLLVEKAQTANVVVRLKGGDPFIFGRGGEECQVLAEAGIPFEVVPGVSSAYAVPAYAGIPITHRECASQFTVVTAHDRDGKLPDWDSLPRQGTLVFLMGVAYLPEIAAGLQAHGWAAETPVAVIHRGTTLQQQVVVGALDQIAVQASHLKPPSVIVVGEVVSLSSSLRWFNPDAALSSTMEH
jgi:uroporphyrin-III C-methyltransferase